MNDYSNEQIATISFLLGMMTTLALWAIVEYAFKNIRKE